MTTVTMQHYDTIDRSSQSPQQRREHMRKALKVLRDGRLSFVDLVCTILDPTERDFERHREALYTSPTNDSPIKLHRILDRILQDTRGAQLFRQWMKPRVIEMASNNIHHESDPTKEGLGGPSSTVTPEILRTSELRSTSVARTPPPRAHAKEQPHPPASRAPQRTPTANAIHLSHISHKSHTVGSDFPRQGKYGDAEALFARDAEHMRWQEERNRGDQARNQGAAGQVVVSDEGSPEWYIRKFLNGTITVKQVSSVWISLRGHETSWLHKFIDCGGTAVLVQSLAQISRKSRRSSADIPLEQEIAKCLKVIFNSTRRVRDAVKIPDIITHITSALNSPHLPTRRTIIEVLLSVVYCSRDSLDLVFHGLATLSQVNGDSTGCYDYWFQSLEDVLRGRGEMGSYVGASDKYKRAGRGGGALIDYALINIGLIVHIMDVMDDLDVRIHHRTAMDSAGLPRIVGLCRELGIAAMDKQLDELATVLEEDERRLRERQENAIPARFSNTKDI